MNTTAVAKTKNIQYDGKWSYWTFVSETFTEFVNTESSPILNRSCEPVMAFHGISFILCVYVCVTVSVCVSVPDPVMPAACVIQVATSGWGRCWPWSGSGCLSAPCSPRYSPELWPGSAGRYREIWWGSHRAEMGVGVAGYREGEVWCHVFLLVGWNLHSGKKDQKRLR